MTVQVSQISYDYVENIIADWTNSLANVQAQLDQAEANKAELLQRIADAEAVLADLEVE